MKISWNSFLDKITSLKELSSSEKNILEKAYYYGDIIYENIKRKNGEPYLNHCLRTAINLAEVKMDCQSLVAGILHDSLEESKINRDFIKSEFDDEIAYLVEGVTKISSFKYRNRNAIQAENLRKLIIYLSKDIRVAVIKLADRLDNMRTLQYLSLEKQKRIALETEDIYAPLAIRLNINQWANELSNLAFKFLNPAMYKFIELEIKKIVDNGVQYLEEIKAKVYKELINKKININAIDYRIKTPASIHKKLKRKDFDLTKIYDILAFRIIVSTVEECYLTLGIIHNLFTPLANEFDDYIALPKPNGYRSIHTTVIGPNNKFIEFQIKTKEMHIYNEQGIAAYFAYASGKDTSNYIKNRSIFANEDELRLVELLQRKKLTNEIKDFLQEKIYVFTPKGDIVELNNDSTPIDFAYKIHSDLGNHLSAAKVNGHFVSLDYKLQNGDIVEIFTSKNKKPSLDWLKIVKSYETQKKIKSYLKKQNLAFTRPYSFILEIIANDRIGLLKDITNFIALKKCNIVKSKIKVKKNIANLYFEIQANSKDSLEKIKFMLKNKIKDIIEIR